MFEAGFYVSLLSFSSSWCDSASRDTRNISGLHHSLHSVDMGFVTFICFCLFRPSDKFSYGFFLAMAMDQVVVQLKEISSPIVLIVS